MCNALSPPQAVGELSGSVRRAGAWVHEAGTATSASALLISRCMRGTRAVSYKEMQASSGGRVKPTRRPNEALPQAHADGDLEMI
jgi:hypothetical protein